MTTLARRKRHFAARAGFLGLLLATISVTWAGAAGQTGYWEFSYVGHTLFVTFTLTQMLAVALLVPALTAPIIAAEKERDTLGLLLMTNLSHASILLDKLLSRLALVGLLLLSALPLFLALLAMGGITPGLIALAYANTLAVILFAAGLGLLCSTLMDRLHTALIATYAAMVGYLLFLFVLTVVLGYGFRPLDFLPYVDDSVSGSPNSIFPGVAVAVFVLGTLLSIQWLPRVASRTRRPLIKRVFAALNAFFHSINFTGVVVMREGRDPGANPLLWKETQKYFFASRIFLLRSVYVILMLGMITVAGTNCLGGSLTTPADLALLLSGVLLIVLGTVALLTGSAALAGERDRHTFEIILTTPLTAAQIVLAKFAGTLRILIPLLVALAGALALATYASGLSYRYSSRDTPGLLQTLVFCIGFVPALAVIGLRASAARRSVSAAFLHACVVFVAWSALPLLVYIILQLVPYGNSPEAAGAEVLWDLSLALTPVTAGAWLLMDDMRSSMSDLVFLSQLLLVPLWVLGLMRLIHRFDRLMGRR